MLRRPKIRDFRLPPSVDEATSTSAPSWYKDISEKVSLPWEGKGGENGTAGEGTREAVAGEV